MPKYLYRRAVCHWLKICRQVDPSGNITYPWQGSALTTTRWSDGKILRTGFQGLREAIAARLVSGGNPKAGAGGQGHGHGPNFFSTMSEAFRKKYMTFTTMGHVARHPHHGWRRGKQFRQAIGAQRKPSAPWHTTMHLQQHRVLSM